MWVNHTLIKFNLLGEQVCILHYVEGLPVAQLEMQFCEHRLFEITTKKMMNNNLTLDLS